MVLKQNLLMHYNYDDILLSAENLDQMLIWFKKRYKKLNHVQKESLKYFYLDNKYMNNIIKQTDNDIKEEKKQKIIEKYKKDEREKNDESKN